MDDIQCRYWSSKDMLCRGFYDEVITGKFTGLKLDKNDFDLEHCKMTGGKSNCAKCVWFMVVKFLWQN